MMSYKGDGAVSKIAEAFKEVGKPISETGCRLIESLLGKPCEVAGGMLTDRVYAWQWYNRISIAEKAAQKMKDASIAPRVLPPGFFLEFLASAGNVDDETLQDLWASLLANASKDDEHVHPLFINTLRQLSPSDATFLADFRCNLRIPVFDGEPAGPVAVENLVVLGVMHHVPEGSTLGVFRSIEGTEFDWDTGATEFAVISAYGMRLLEALGLYKPE